MKSYLNKAASAAGGVAVFLLGCMMAGLGLSMMVLLATFGLAVVGLGILATPFLALLHSKDQTQDETVTA